MLTERLRTFLDSPDEGCHWLKELGLNDAQAGHSNLVRLAQAGVPLDLLAEVCEQFESVAPRLADADMALNNLERFLLAARSPLSTAALFERDKRALPHLLRLLTASQDLSDWLCTDPESYDLLRMTEGLPYARDSIINDVTREIAGVETEAEALSVIRRFKRRETLRIVYGDVVEEHPVEQVTRQISYVADALVEAALQFVRRRRNAKLSSSEAHSLANMQFVVLALGKLGGQELNYSSDIDLVFLHHAADSSERDAAVNYATHVAQDLIRLLTEATDLGFAYRVDMRLRPEGKHAPLTHDIDQALAYYDLRGRTWERQAYIKARVIAGDTQLGDRFLNELEPWIYRTYLSLADIAGIKSLKRKIESRAEAVGVADTNVKTGRGGIRDVEFVIQYLQLLNGGALPSVRTGNTLLAIEKLEQAGCLTHQERTLLEENYRFLRRVEHRLQIMFDLQTHKIPRSGEELSKLAQRLGYSSSEQQSARRDFQNDYDLRTAQNRKILDHLLHDAFRDDVASQPEVDLVNDPNPTPEAIEEVLGRYPFKDPRAAYDHLMSLATENIPFLSTRRCRLFLAAIAPRLLGAISNTPDPDGTLVALCRVSDSLGGKAALWELFSRNLPSLNLYVTFCAACPYLTGILTSNPGMIDELLDSLLTTRLPDFKRLQTSLNELARGAEDLGPILHSFKASQHLRIGVRDILGKDDVQATHQALADTAEVCLLQVIAAEHKKLVKKLGQPLVGTAPAAEDGSAPLDNAPAWSPPASRVGQPCELVVVAIGKLGGCEPNFHSDLDLVFLYEAEGNTEPLNRQGHSTSNSHFFGELAQRVIKSVNQFGPQGQLYEVDPRLRPTGRSGRLAVSLESFVRYFDEGEGQLWERQALCKARVLSGSPETVERANLAIHQAVYGNPWVEENLESIRQMRHKLEESASPRNLKRSRGGTMDTEFIVQMLQLKHGRQHPHICHPNTLEAIQALATAKLLTPDQAQLLSNGYRFQRNVESRIRLMDSSGRHEFPTEPIEQARLALLLGYANADVLEAEVEQTFDHMRACFDEFFPQ